MANLKVQRERFYSAENLKTFASKHLLTNDYFKDLADDIYYGIYDLLGKLYVDGYERLNDVMAQVVRIDLKHNLLSKYDLVHPQDRQGICQDVYKRQAQNYNRSIKQFPKNIIASMFGFESVEYYEASDGAQNAPNVDFD